MMNTEQRKITEKTDNTSALEVGCVCGACILILGLIAGVIAYMVFGIMFLVQDYEVAHDCNGSALWAYVLTAIILAFSRGNARNAQDDNNNFNFGVLFCLGLIEAGLAIWGGIELFAKSCDDLADSNLWKFGLATFIIQTLVATICLLTIPMVVICCELRFHCCEKKKEEEDKLDNV